MLRQAAPAVRRAALPAPSALLALLKPITWFPPMWAFGCGLVSGGLTLPRDLALLVAGIVLAGPLLCGTSQAVNDWFDRHVDAINEPDRPEGIGFALACTAASLVAAAALGRWVLLPALLGTGLSWAYSAPPLRLKANGWFGNTAVALSYEGLAWLAGAAVVAQARPDGRVLLLALLYSVGAHGIMTLNDFKSVAGDTRLGIRSLPVQLGVKRAARLACTVMLLPQLAVAAALLSWNRPGFALAVGALAAGQVLLMPGFLRDPRGGAARYNATGTGLFVAGMMVAAFALRSLVGGDA